MKHTKRILAAILALVLMLTPMVSVGAAEEADSTDVLYTFELEEFLNTLPNSKIQYDYYKLITALQGLVNRDKPQLYFFSFTNGAPKSLGYDMDEFWFENITDDELGYGELNNGGDLADYKIVKVKSFWKLLRIFGDYYNGIVLWDEDVPSTANVASTIAGVENLLPVRYATGAEDLYLELFNYGFSEKDIKRDLCGLFSGKGYIPTLGSSVPGAEIEYTTTPSTLSQKTDPYIWAKLFYLDTGLTHPLHMTYSLDGRTFKKSDWPTGESETESKTEKKAGLAGELVSLNVPTVMGPGEVRQISLTYQNTGTEIWSESTYDRFAINLEDGPFRLWTDEEATKYDTGDKNRLKLKNDVEPGESYTVTGYISAPKLEGEYSFDMWMNREAYGDISPHYKATITVERGGALTAEDKYVPYTPYEVVEQETIANNAAIVKAGIGATVAPNASGTVQVVVKNTGTQAWPAGGTYVLQYKVGSNAAATLNVPTATDPGQSVSFNVPYTAPASGSMDIRLQMVTGGEKFGETYTCSAEVEGSTGASTMAAEIVSVTTPKSLTAGAKAEVVVEVLNSGDVAWTDAVKLVDASGKGYMSAEGVADDDDKLVSALAIEPGVTVEPGDTYRFHLDLHTYTNNGTKKTYLQPKTLASVELQVNSGSTAISGSEKVSYEIIDACDTPVTVYADASDYALTNYEYNARFLSAAMPTTMEVGELVPIQLTLKNIGTATWESIKAGRSYLRMAFRGAQNGFGFITNLATGTGDVGDLNRIDITNGVVVKPGDTYTYTAYLRAPAEAGIYDVRLDGLVDKPTTWATADKTFTITVIDPANQAALNVLETEDAQMLELEPELEVKAVDAISADVPASSEPYTELSVTATAENTTSAAWTAPSGVSDVLVNKTPTAAGVYMKYTAANPFNPTTTNKTNPFVYYAPLAANTAAGAKGTFSLKFNVPVVEGTYDLKMQVVSISGSTETVLVSEVTEQYAAASATPAATPSGTLAMSGKSETYKVEFVSAKIPAKMDPGEEAFISLTYKNLGSDISIMSTVAQKADGSSNIASRGNIGLVAQSGTGGFSLKDYGFGLSFTGDSTAGNGMNGDQHKTGWPRLNLREGQPDRIFTKNETQTFTGKIVAPEAPGTYTLSFAGVVDLNTPASDATQFVVEVVDPNAKAIVTGMSETAEPYTKVTLTAKAKNETTSAWTVPTGVTEPVQSHQIDDGSVYGQGKFHYVLPTVAGTYLKYTYLNPYNPTSTSRINPFVYYAPLSAATAVGAEGKFDLSLNVPVVEGKYELKTQVVSISGTTETALTEEIVDEFEVKTATPKATVTSTTTATGKSTTYKTEFVEAKIPATMKAGESAFVSITYKNLAADMAIMNAAFAENRATVGLVAQSGNGGFSLTDYGMGLAETGERELSWAKTNTTLKNQLNLREGNPERNFPKNQSRTFTGVLTAPTTPGTYTISFAGLSKASVPTSDYTNFTVVVTGDNAGGEQEETPSATKTVVFHESATVTTEDYDATIMSAVLPETVRPGEKIAVSFTVKNTGKQTFKSHLNAPNKEESLRLAFLTDTVVGYYKATDTFDANGYMAKKFFVLSDSTTATGSGAPWTGAANGQYSRMDMLSGKTVASGDTYTYTGHLIAPTTAGTYTFEVNTLADVAGAGSKTWYSDKEKITIKVVDPDAEEEVKNNVIFHESADMTTEQYKAAIMGAKVPLQVDPGEKFDVSFTVKNIGTGTFKSARDVAANNEACLRLAFFGAAEFHSTTREIFATNGDKLDAKGLMANKFFVLCSSTTTQRDDAPWAGAANREYNRLDLLSGKTLASGESYTYTGSFVAPSKDGEYTLQIIALTETGNAGYRSAKETITIVVGEPDAYTPEEPTYTTLERDADVLLASIPNLYNGETGKLNVYVKNTGSSTWTKTTDGEAGYYLRLRIGNESFYVPVSGDTATGETAAFTCDYTAPDRESSPSVTAQMVYRNSNKTNKFFGEQVTGEIIVKLDTGARAAEILSVQYPESLAESAKGTLMVEVLNTGAMTWNSNNKIVLSENDEKVYLSAPGTADDSALSSEIAIEPGVTVKPGERYVFVADLHSWTMFKSQRDYVMPNTNLELELQLDAISGESTGKFGDKIATVTEITTKQYTADTTVYAESADYPVDESATHKAVLLSASVPSKMAPGQLMKVQLTFKNIGTTSWWATSPVTTLNHVRLRTDTHGAFDMCSDAAGTAGWTGNRDRVPMSGSNATKANPVESGETYTYEFYLKAPTTAGDYTFNAYLINDGVSGGFEEKTYGVNFPIQVGTPKVLEETEVATSKVQYSDLMQTAVGNSDYYIMHKAFFWDLAMDESIAPIDDRTQPVGTDVKVLRQLLDSQRKRAQAYEEGKDPWNKVAGVGEGYGIFQVGGFLPWFMKYCMESDPQSKFSAAQQEWQQMMHISEYGGGSDADAFGTITISNCSVFSNIKNNVKKFSANVTQAQEDFDPAVGDPTVTYDPEKTYILWHMGDWDGSSWTASILPGLWETDPRRGEIPVGWAVAAGNSWRIPQLFNWQYNNATPNDYFIAGDNGFNYYDPNMNSRPHTEVTGITEEMGDEILQDFVAYNQYFNDIFSIDVTGLLHTAGSGPSDDDVRAAFQQITPYGVGVTQEGANTKLEDIGIFVGEDGTQTPFIPSYVFTATSDGTLKTTVASLAANLASKIKYGRQFQVLRTVKVKVTSLCEIMEAMEAANPGIDQMYEVVDPYTFMRLARESNGGYVSRGAATCDLVSGTAKIDGEISAGEWDKAKDMHVSPTSGDIAKNGRNWAPTTLATESDLNTKFRVMWDNNYLYVVENRSDDGHIGTSKTNGMDWTADAGAVYISLDGLENGGSYYPGDYAVIFNVTTDGKTNVWMRAGGENGVKTERQLNANEYVAAVRLGVGGNYVYEIAIPWSTLGGNKPAAGSQVGLAMLAIDGDEGLVGGGRQIMWGGAGDDQSSWAKAMVKY